MRGLPLILMTPLLLVAASCPEQAIHGGTSCQYKRFDPGWVEAGLGIRVSDPPPEHCPISLDFYGQLISLAADVTAPVGTAFGALIWRVHSARGPLISSGQAPFLLGPESGREMAQAEGQYNAGLPGDSALSQDRLNSEVTLARTGERVRSDVYLPYRCCNRQSIAFTGVPRTRRNQATTVRAIPNLPASPTPRFEWFRNGVAFTPPSNPWNVGGLNGTAYTFTPSATGHIDWKVKASWGFPTRSKTIQWRQYVDP